MPDLKNILAQRTKKFAKKQYRPWDLSGTSAAASQPSETTPALTEANNIPAAQKTTDETLLEYNYFSPNTKFENTTLDNKSGNVTGNNQVTRGNELSNRLDNTSLRNRIAKLTGIQQRILDFIVNVCIAKDDLKTGPFETITLSQYIEKSTGSTKTSINRLINKGFLKRGLGRAARGGYINLELPNEIKLVILELRKDIKQDNRTENFVYSLCQNLDNKSLYSSSSYNNNTTTDQKLLPNALPDEWKKIDCEVLSAIGFNREHLRQLAGKNIPEIVQESINHFSYALENNPKYKNHANPLNVFMGVLRKGQAWFEKDYISPLEKAQAELIKRKGEEAGEGKKTARRGL